MSQALLHSPLQLQMMPMRVPESDPGFLAILPESAEAPVAAGRNLLVHPDRPSAMMVKLQNVGNVPLESLRLEVNGMVPEEWCRIQLEQERMEGGDRQTAILEFRVPKNFFDDPPFMPKNHALILDYVGQLNVYGRYATPPSSPTPSEHATQMPRGETGSTPSPLQGEGWGGVEATENTPLNPPLARGETGSTPYPYQGEGWSGVNSPEYLIESVSFNLYIRPESRYLNFLPNIYRDIDFVGRFLHIVERGLEPDVEILNNMWAYLDPLTAPEAMLPFLAHWVGWDVKPYLSLEQQRALMRRALDIYRWRGTRRGLRLYLHLATGLPLDDDRDNEADKHISITEPFSQGFVVNSAQMGADTSLGQGKTCHFTVHLRPDRVQDPSSPNPIDERLVRTIIDQEKPAFCTYDLYIHPPHPHHAATPSPP